MIFFALFEWLVEWTDDRFGRLAAWTVGVGLIAALPALVLLTLRIMLH